MNKEYTKTGPIKVLSVLEIIVSTKPNHMSLVTPLTATFRFKSYTLKHSERFYQREPLWLLRYLTMVKKTARDLLGKGQNQILIRYQSDFPRRQGLLR
jgi:hypothetical protein